MPALPLGRTVRHGAVPAGAARRRETKPNERREHEPIANECSPAAGLLALGTPNPTTGRYTPEGPITVLDPNEVFVFGSNAAGFHGAGAAGWAYTGQAGNQYRAGNPMLRARHRTRGYWARLGIARGWQQGQHGRSYALCTIRRPGAKRSVPLTEIRQQVEQLYRFAAQHPQLAFLVVQTGSATQPGHNGYSLAENASCYLERLESSPSPGNVPTSQTPPA